MPTIAPVVRGMFNWNSDTLLTSMGLDRNSEDVQMQQKVAGIKNFLDRIYYELRNLGISSRDRAMNYAATNAFQLKEVFQDAIATDLVLDSIDVEVSPVSRPNSDCWDVKLQFFNPAKRQEVARKVYRYTVDVADFVPVTVGELRSWFVY